MASSRVSRQQSLLRPNAGSRNLRQRSPPAQCHRPINFGVCRTEFTASSRPISADVNLGLFCARRLSENGAIHVRGLGSSLRSELPHLRLDHGKSPWLRCQTQSPPSWSLTMTRTFEPRLGACCDRSILMFGCLRPLFPTFSTPICRMASRLPGARRRRDCRGQSGLDFQRENSPGRIGKSRIIFITGHGDIPMSVQAMKGRLSLSSF